MKNNKLDDLIEEAFSDGASIFGGAKGGGAGTFSYAQVAGARTWAPQSPSKRSSTSDSYGYNIKDIAEEEEEFNHPAPRKRPFPMETIHDHLVQSYLFLTNAEAQMRSALKYNAALVDTNKDKKALLGHLHRKLKTVQYMIKNISEDLDRVSLA